MGSAEGLIRVELAYSPRAGEVWRLCLDLPQGTTIADAIALSGWDLPPGLVPGIAGRVRDASDALRDEDRLELLRPLNVEPMEARRLRHQARKTPKP